MAKKNLILLALIINACVCFGQIELPATAESITATAMADDADILNINVKELHLNITPSFKLVLPDTSVKLGLRQKLGDTTLEGMTEYNYIYNKIKYMLKYGLELFMPMSVSIYDNVDFEQLYQDKKYIQRTKGIGAAISSPLLLGGITLSQELKNETYYIANLKDVLDTSDGVATVINSKIDITTKSVLPGKDSDAKYADWQFDFNLEKAIPHKYSPINYMFLDMAIVKTIKFDKFTVLDFRTESGYLFLHGHLPLWKLYKLGGYDRLIGYEFDKLQGYYKNFARVKYEANPFGDLGWELGWLKFDRIRPFMVADFGCAGDIWTVQAIKNYRGGLGAGVVLDITFRKRTPIKITLAIGQALEAGYAPVFYFVHELL